MPFRVDTIKEAVLSLLNSPDDLESLSINAKLICDGKGLPRIANSILGPLGPYTLTTAKISDSDLYYQWVNDPQVRLSSINTHLVSNVEHANWFKSSITSPLVLMLILRDRFGFPLGQIRFSRDLSDISRVKISFHRCFC